MPVTKHCCYHDIIIDICCNALVLVCNLPPAFSTRQQHANEKRKATSTALSALTGATKTLNQLLQKQRPPLQTNKNSRNDVPKLPEQGTSRLCDCLILCKLI